MPHRVDGTDSPSGLAKQWPCRDDQIEQLEVLIHTSLPGPSTLVVHGPEATGKTGLLTAHLEACSIPHVVIQSRECITSRHLFERAATACIEKVTRITGAVFDPPRCESVNAFAAQLSTVLRDVPRFVLVLDGIDEQRDGPATLLPALATIGSMIDGLTLVIVVRHPDTRMLHTTGTPHVYFAPYDEGQSVAILARDPPTSDVISHADVSYLWARYLPVIWNSMAKGVARDLASFRNIAHRLWLPFVRPVTDGTYGPRELSRLVIAQTRLLQDESFLGESMLDTASETPIDHELPYHSKWLLCAAYLASFNSPAQDQIYFMKTSERKRRRNGGGRKSTTRKIPRHLLSPSPFSLDRLMAVMRAIYPFELSSTSDMYTQISTLTSLRLLVKSAVLSADMLEPSARWKVNFGLDHALTTAKTVDFGMSDYLAS